MPEINPERLNEIFPLSEGDVGGDPFRLKIQKSLAAAFMQIKTHNGFLTDVAAVHRGKNVLGAECELPCVTILEDPPQSETSPPHNSSARSQYNLIVQGFAIEDKDHPTDEIQKLLTDIRLRLALIRMRKGFDIAPFQLIGKSNRVESLDFDSAMCRPPQVDKESGASQSAFCVIAVRTTITEDLAKPLS